MIITRVEIENFKSIKKFNQELKQDFVNLNDYVINSSSVELWKTDFVDAVKWGLGVYFNFHSMVEMLHPTCFEKLDNLESEKEVSAVKVEFQENEKIFVLTKYVSYIFSNDKVQSDKVWFTLNGQELSITEHIDFCSKFYNSAFAYVSFIEDFNFNTKENLSLQLWQDRFINLLNAVNFEEELQGINKVAKNFKISKKQLHLQLDENFIPHWYKPKGTLYLNGNYSESESKLRFIYYKLALNEYISKKFEKNLPIFIGQAINSVDSEQKEELIRTLKKMNKQIIRCE